MYIMLNVRYVVPRDALLSLWRMLPSGKHDLLLGMGLLGKVA